MEENKSDFKNQRLLTTKEAMLYLGIKSRVTFRKLISEKALLNVSLDDLARYDKYDLDKIIEENKKQKKREVKKGLLKKVS